MFYQDKFGVWTIDTIKIQPEANTQNIYFEQLWSYTNESLFRFIGLDNS